MVVRRRSPGAFESTCDDALSEMIKVLVAEADQLGDEAANFDLLLWAERYLRTVLVNPPPDLDGPCLSRPERPSEV
jgi:hypothetical protein